MNLKLSLRLVLTSTALMLLVGLGQPALLLSAPAAQAAEPTLLPTATFDKLFSLRLHFVPTARGFVRQRWVESNSGQILFISGTSLGQGHDIYIMNTDGMNVRRLTNGQNPAEARFSPDGSKIVFSSSRLIYTINADGTNLQQLRPGTNPDWSPNGSRIVYECSGICTMNAGGRGIRQLTTSIADRHPRWSHDGSKIVFQKSEETGSNWVEDIYVMNAYGVNQTNLTRSPDSHDVMPDWSPDDSKIAFTRWSEAYRDYIYVVDADGTGAHPITGNEHNEHPIWSPDGARIAFNSNRGGPLRNIYVMGVDGSDSTRLTYRDEWPTDWWSPNPTSTPAPGPTATLPSTGYLPLIRRNPAAPPTPMPAVCDSGFEAGRFEPCWDHGGELAQRVVDHLDTGDPPLAGRYSALLGQPELGSGTAGNIPAGSAWIQQRIRVPNTTRPRLTFQYRVISYDASLGSRGQLWDTFDTTIGGELVFRDDEGGDRPPGSQGDRHDTGWQRGAVDLSRWRGQEVSLRFAVWNREYDGNGMDYYNTWAYLDQVRVEP